MECEQTHHCPPADFLTIKEPKIKTGDFVNSIDNDDWIYAVFPLLFQFSFFFFNLANVKFVFCFSDIKVLD